MFTRITRGRLLGLLLVIAAICLWIAPLTAGEKTGGETPEAVFKAAQEAGAKKDFGALAKLVAPSEHPMLAFGTDMGVRMFVEFYEGETAEKLKKSYQELQNKHGVKTEKDDGEKLHMTQDTPQKVIDEHMLKRAKKLYGTVDAAKYVPDLMNLIIDMPEMAEQAFFAHEELTDLKIDGDKAVGKAGDESIKFIREDGRWHLTAAIMD